MNIRLRESRSPKLRTIISLGFVGIGILASSLVAISVYSSFSQQIRKSLNKRLDNIATITVLEIDGNEHANIINTEAENDSNYIKYQKLLNAILASDNELIYIYTIRQMDDGTIFFILDAGSDPTIAEYEFDLPGMVSYDEPSDLLLETFANPSGTVVESDIYTDEFGSFLSAYAPIYKKDGSLDGILGVDISADAIIAKEQNALLRVLSISIAAILLTTFVGLFIGNRLVLPLVTLTTEVNRIAGGNLEKITDIPARSFETFQLIHAFNAMAAKIKELLGNLEKLIAERTAELEAVTQQSQRRAAQFEAISQVASRINASQDLESLLPKVTNVISEHFGFYHVGIFLLDAEREFAVLRAANSPGGKKMLERAHQLKVGETGIVGFVTSQGKPRIALDTGSDSVYFDNPDLPDTRSEMALPLITGNRLIGALDVQSLEPNAFSEEDINTLSTLADQVSIAIQNVSLYEETRLALSQSQVLYQQFSQAGWNQFRQARKLRGIRKSRAHVTFLEESFFQEDSNDKSMLDLPIKLRDQKIGSLKIQAVENHQWAQDEIDIASAIIERAAIALENARLLDDARRRANREHIIGEISATVSSSTDMEEILRSAVQELGRRMGGAEVILELGVTSNPENKTSNQRGFPEVLLK